MPPRRGSAQIVLYPNEYCVKHKSLAFSPFFSSQLSDHSSDLQGTSSHSQTSISSLHTLGEDTLTIGGRGGGGKAVPDSVSFRAWYVSENPPSVFDASSLAIAALGHLLEGNLPNQVYPSEVVKPSPLS